MLKKSYMKNLETTMKLLGVKIKTWLLAMTDELNLLEKNNT